MSNRHIGRPDDLDPTNGRVSLLILATTVPTSPDDGVPSFVLDLACALSETATVTILAPRVSGAPNRSTVGRVTIVRFPYFPRRWEGLATDAIMPTLRAEPRRWVEVPFLVASMCWHTWRLSGRRRFDAINAHWILPSGFVARIVGRLRGIPYLVTVHGGDAYTLNRPLMNQVKARVLRHAASSIPVSAHIAETIRNIAGPEANIHSPVPMGVAGQGASQQIRNGTTFLFVGRLAEKKGVDTAMEAIADVPNAKLKIIGDGPELNRLMDLSDRLKLGGRVTFLGRQPRDSVLSEMKMCTALLIPSVIASDGDTDGTPVVLAEAMSCGTPVIASQIAGLADYIDDGVTGFLVQPGDANMLADTMRNALADGQHLKKVGDLAAYRFASSPLDIAYTAKEYSAVLDRITPGNRGDSGIIPNSE